MLGRAADAISVGAVVRMAEGGAAPAECYDSRSNTCVITPACRLRPVLDEAVAAFYAVLNEYTLADLAAQPRTLARILALAPGAEVTLRRMDRRSPRH